MMTEKTFGAPVSRPYSPIELTVRLFTATAAPEPLDALEDDGDVEARLLVVDQFKNINVKGQLVAPEENVPSRRFSGSGLRHGQLFVFSHHQHL